MTNTLIKSIKSLVTERIKSPLNRIKPLISFGQSPARTMADGITLHFDFREYGAVEQQLMFDKYLGADFFRALRLSLGDDKEDADANSTPLIDPPLTGPADAYFINLIVPSECLALDAGNIDHCAFFSMDNLEQIADHINLILVDLSTRSVGDTVLHEMKEIRATIEDLPVESQILFLKKIVPLATLPKDSSEASSLPEKFDFADWNFSGFGFWRVQAGEETKAALTTSFLDKQENSLVDRFEAKVCNFVCPHRWALRVLIFSLAVAFISLAVAALWFFHLRKLFETKKFRMGVVVVAAALVASLYCDPFWTRYRSHILFLFIIAWIVLLFIYHWKKDRQTRYP